MSLQELRPLIQRDIGLEEWPKSDCIVVEMIFNLTGIQLNWAAAQPFYHNWINWVN